MATFTGNFGKVKYGAGATGAGAVAEVKKFSLKTSVKTIDDGSMGDEWETHLTGRKNWSGEMTCNYDSTDTNGQLAFVSGASVAGKFFPESDTTGKKFQGGTCTINDVTIESELDGVITWSCTFVGNGPLTPGTVA